SWGALVVRARFRADWPRLLGRALRLPLFDRLPDDHPGVPEFPARTWHRLAWIAELDSGWAGRYERHRADPDDSVSRWFRRQPDGRPAYFDAPLSPGEYARFAPLGAPVPADDRRRDVAVQSANGDARHAPIQLKTVLFFDSPKLVLRPIDSIP